MDDTQFDQNMVMEDMWRELHVPQQENNNLCQIFEQLQVGAPLVPQNSKDASNQQIFQLILQPIREPRINISGKFDGTWSKFWGFVNQIRHIFRLQPWQYPIGASQVGLIGTL
jgi:hypothetical protein